MGPVGKLKLLRETEFTASPKVYARVVKWKRN